MILGVKELLKPEPTHQPTGYNKNRDSLETVILDLPREVIFIIQMRS